MKKMSMLFIGLLSLLLLSACSKQAPVTENNTAKNNIAEKQAEVTTPPAHTQFVRVNGGHFELHGKPYVITGVNMWYAAYLGAPNDVGDRERLAKELDNLQSIGVNNLRVLAVSEKSDINSAVKPATTNGFGNYDESLLQGLDYLLVELAKRDMTVVLYFNNFWQFLNP